MAGLAAVTGLGRRSADASAPRAPRRGGGGLNRLPHVTCRGAGRRLHAFRTSAPRGGRREPAQRLLDEAYVALVPGELRRQWRGFEALPSAPLADIEEALARMALFLVTARPVA
jgi:hypothetical protein